VVKILLFRNIQF